MSWRLLALGTAGMLGACALSCARPPTPADALARAVDYFGTEVREVDPSWGNLFPYLHRRFGLVVRNAAGDPLHAETLTSQRPELAALYRRLQDPAASVPAALIAQLESQIDRMTALALHCDRVALPANWTDVLRAASRAGGYALTHAALAGRWSLENGCVASDAIEAVAREQANALGALVEQRGTLAKQFDTPTDLWIEALAMLYYLEEGGRVSSAWIDDLLRAQRADGGWPGHPRAPRSDPHATALAVWVLLEQLQPEAAPIAWVPRASSS